MESLKPGLYCVAGAAALAFVGFAWGGWVTGGTLKQKAAIAGQTATVAALAPICADKFERAADADDDMVVKLIAVKSKDGGSYLLKSGWATFPGGAEPDSKVAIACFDLLRKIYKIE